MNDTKQDNGTGVTSSGHLPVHVPTDSEIESIRAKGAALVAHNREVNKLTKMIEGMEWGTGSMAVKGTSFSPATRYAFAEFCKVVGANPQMHVDILGGRFYLNSGFWFERINKDERFVDYEQRNISQDDEARAHYAVPDWATYAYETIIRKLVPFAPIEKIRSGDITNWQQYVVETREANWAGNKPKAKKRDGGEYDADPVGNAEPAKTARTRSLRRAAVRAFPAWMEAYETQIRKAEDALEAEWWEIKSDAKQLPSGNAIASGNGEPTATRAALPEPLPVRDLSNVGRDTRTPEPVQRQANTSTRSAEPQQSAPPATEQDTGEAEPTGEFTPADRQDLRKRLFPDLKEHGITDEDGRKAWARENKLPDSTKTWTRADFDEAFRILEGPARAELLDAVGALGFESVDEFCQARSLDVPVTLKDTKALTRVVQASR